MTKSYLALSSLDFLFFFYIIMRAHVARLGAKRSNPGTTVTFPSAMSSAIAAPDAGAFRMPQQECPVATYTFLVFGTLPMIGAPSLVTGRWQLWPFSLVVS
jgi:hypothetical protein